MEQGVLFKPIGLPNTALYVGKIEKLGIMHDHTQTLHGTAATAAPERPL